jgi:hypothetical protein
MSATDMPSSGYNENRGLLNRRTYMFVESELSLRKVTVKRARLKRKTLAVVLKQRVIYLRIRERTARSL